MKKYFGTDGIRGVAGGNILNLDFVIRLAKAAAITFSSEKGGKRVLIGRDTRLSGDFLESALASTFASLGWDVLLLGITSTPAFALLTPYYEANFGIMISASHNPFYDNGLKFFGHDGFKLSDEKEEEIENNIDRPAIFKTKDNIGRIQNASIEPYLTKLCKIQEGAMNLNLLFDCANGSASRVMPQIKKRLGLNATLINAAPDGININTKCGSLFIDDLAKTYRNKEFDFMFAFDGDADRVLIADKDGIIWDGDKIIALFAMFLKKHGRLKNNAAVITQMSNLGLLNFLKKQGIDAHITKVGDRYVLEEMLESDAVIGGEQSGHIINRMFLSTGDGIASALFFLKIAQQSPDLISIVRKGVKKYPQILINRHVAAKPELLQIPKIKNEHDAIQQNLGADGRIVLRYSGTEPLVRVMIEGPDKALIENMANHLADTIAKEIEVL